MTSCRCLSLSHSTTGAVFGPVNGLRRSFQKFLEDGLWLISAVWTSGADQCRLDRSEVDLAELLGGHKVSDLIIADNSVIGLSVAKILEKTRLSFVMEETTSESSSSKSSPCQPLTPWWSHEPTHLLEEIIDAWPSGVLPLVIVSNWSVSSYGVRVKEKGARKIMCTY